MLNYVEIQGWEKVWITFFFSENSVNINMTKPCKSSNGIEADVSVFFNFAGVTEGCPIEKVMRCFISDYEFFLIF